MALWLLPSGYSAVMNALTSPSTNDLTTTKVVDKVPTIDVIGLLSPLANVQMLTSLPAQLTALGSSTIFASILPQNDRTNDKAQSTSTTNEAILLAQNALATTVAGIAAALLPALLQRAAPLVRNQHIQPQAPPQIATTQLQRPSLIHHIIMNPALGNRLNFSPQFIQKANEALMMLMIQKSGGLSQVGALPQMPAAPVAASPSKLSLIDPTILFPQIFGFVAATAGSVMKQVADVGASLGSSHGSEAATVPSGTSEKEANALMVEAQSHQTPMLLQQLGPMQHQLKCLALLAGRNIALAALYYFLTKYCLPAGVSLKVAFTLASLLLDVLI
eukprot:GILI01011064.1.p1 GENE.GILI01011064.1~~GILI01011064.1.p1  ORF type:complete len:332 (+),score=57.58 GILI01011064.1:58-1053(+)